MSFVVADRVKETSTSTGTGNFTLAGAVDSFISFNSGVGAGNRTYYTIALQGGSQFEVGIGTLSDPTTLVRDTVITSSNSDNLVIFSAGTKDVFVAQPANRAHDASVAISLALS